MLQPGDPAFNTTFEERPLIEPYKTQEEDLAQYQMITLICSSSTNFAVLSQGESMLLPSDNENAAKSDHAAGVFRSSSSQTYRHAFNPVRKTCLPPQQVTALGTLIESKDSAHPRQPKMSLPADRTLQASLCNIPKEQKIALVKKAPKEVALSHTMPKKVEQSRTASCHGSPQPRPS